MAFSSHCSQKPNEGVVAAEVVPTEPGAEPEVGPTATEAGRVEPIVAAAGAALLHGTPTVGHFLAGGAPSG